MAMPKDGTINIKTVGNGTIISFSADFKVLNEQNVLVPIQPNWVYQSGQEAQVSAKIVEVAGLTIA